MTKAAAAHGSYGGGNRRKYGTLLQGSKYAKIWYLTQGGHQLKRKECAVEKEFGAARHALRNAVAGVESVGGERSGQLPQVVRLVNRCIQQAAG